MKRPASDQRPISNIGTRTAYHASRCALAWQVRVANYDEWQAIEISFAELSISEKHHPCDNVYNMLLSVEAGF